MSRVDGAGDSDAGRVAAGTDAGRVAAGTDAGRIAAGTDAGRIAMDAEQVAAVASFYRRSSLVVNAVADDLAARDFGRWARSDLVDPSAEPDPVLSGLASAYAEMSATLSRRLREQSRAAAALADRLRLSAETVSAGDADAAAGVAGETR
ncbi:hypothetical protein [Gordonia paraffinivorans]|uniref:hypothetical protein n=1 Tax=Gordonia paraffinivorans TaxID=175628 RepID=UPI00289E5575|nr:hypothetical protein [Gordonia paraffinivorans]